VKLSVAPERIPIDSLLGATRGTTNALILQTDLMGEIAIVETDPGVRQTAYALLSDMLAVGRFVGEAND
jgi:homoserine dehydrogenase